MGNFAENLNLGNRFRPPRSCSIPLSIPIPKFILHVVYNSYHDDNDMEDEKKKKVTW